MGSDGCVNFLDLGNHSTMYIIALYALHLYNYMCQLFLNKDGKLKMS